jgi:hypothetical protein
MLSRQFLARVALVLVIALAVLAHHGAAPPLPGATGHGAHGSCQDCHHDDGGDTGVVALLAICLGIGVAGLALLRVTGAIVFLRALLGRVPSRHGGTALAVPPRPPPRPPDLTRLCVLLR